MRKKTQEFPSFSSPEGKKTSQEFNKRKNPAETEEEKNPDQGSKNTT